MSQSRAQDRIKNELPCGRCVVCDAPLARGQTFWCSLEHMASECHVGHSPLLYRPPTVSQQAARQKAKRERELTRYLVPVKQA